MHDQAEHEHAPPSRAAGTPRWATVATVVILAAVAGSVALRFVNLRADPSPIEINRNGAFYGDPGLWYGAPLWHDLRGEWYRDREYNPAVVVPFMPAVVTGVVSLSGLDTWLAARLVTAILVSGALIAVMVALWRSLGRWPSLLVGLLMATSYNSFVWSREGMLDLPAASLALIGLCLLLGWRGDRPAWATVAAAVIGFAAVTAKSTLLMAMPGYVVAAWVTAPAGSRPWRDPLVVALIGAGLLAVYAGVLTQVFADDLGFFRTASVTSNTEAQTPRSNSGEGRGGFAYTIARNGYHFVKDGRFMGWGLYVLSYLAAPAALWRLRRKPGYVWVVPLMVWMVLVCGAVVWKGLIVPRYYGLLIAPAAILLSLVTLDLLGSARWRRAGIALCVAIAGIAGFGAARIVEAAATPQYTYRDMGRDIRARIGAEADLDEVVIIGRWPVESAGLAANLPVHGLFGSMDEAVARYQPGYFMMRGALEDDRYNSRKEAAYVRANFELELMATYHILDGHQDEDLPFYLYRIKPKTPDASP